MAGKVSAYNNNDELVISVRNSQNNPITRRDIRTELAKNIKEIKDKWDREKTKRLFSHEFIQSLIEGRDDVYALNLIIEDHGLSIYTGILSETSSSNNTADANKISTSSTGVKEIHSRADDHIGRKQNNPLDSQSASIASSDDDFGTVSDYFTEAVINDNLRDVGAAQLRTYLSKPESADTDSEVHVINTRVDAEVLMTTGECATGFPSDQTIEHDYYPDYFVDDWQPAGGSGGGQSGSTSVTLSFSGIQYERTFEHSNDIEVVDDTPLRDDSVARAKVEMPSNDSDDNPNRFRAESASLAKRTSYDSWLPAASVTYDFSVYGYYYSGRCVYEEENEPLSQSVPLWMY